MAAKKKHLKNRLSYAAFLGINKILSALPCWIVWHTGYVLGLAMHTLNKRRRQIVIHNLSTVHPNKTNEEVLKLSRQVFGNCFANLSCFMNTSNISGGKIEKLLTVKGSKHIQHISDDQCAILLLFHMGNWELLTRIQEVIQNTNPTGAIYRPLKNSYIDEYVKKQRESNGTRLFSRKKGVIEAHKFLKAGGFLGILCDQYAGHAGFKTKLFGQNSSITPLPAILALKHQCPIIPASLETLAPGRWQLRFHKPIVLPTDIDKEAATCIVIKTMEKMMKTYSKDIFWLHDRWRLKRRKRTQRINSQES